MEFLKNLFTPEGFEHAICLLYDPITLLIKIISDGTIAISYMAIIILLYYTIRHVKNTFWPWIIYAFMCFTFWCGMTHVMDLVVLYYPLYRLDALIRLICAMFSLGTLGGMIALIPRINAIPAQVFVAALERDSEQYKLLIKKYNELLIELEENKNV